MILVLYFPYFVYIHHVTVFFIFVTMLTSSAGRYELALNLLPPTKGELNVEK